MLYLEFLKHKNEKIGLFTLGLRSGGLIVACEVGHFPYCHLYLSALTLQCCHQFPQTQSLKDHWITVRWSHRATHPKNTTITMVIHNFCCHKILMLWIKKFDQIMWHYTWYQTNVGLHLIKMGVIGGINNREYKLGWLPGGIWWMWVKFSRYRVRWLWSPPTGRCVIMVNKHYDGNGMGLLGFIFLGRCSEKENPQNHNSNKVWLVMEVLISIVGSVT